MLSKREREELSTVFNMLSTENDGKLGFDEIKAGYTNYYGAEVPDEEIRDIFDRIDTAKSGVIDHSEFVIAALDARKLLSQDKLQAAFRMFDKSGSGIITAAEIRNVLQFRSSAPLSSEVLDQVVR